MSDENLKPKKVDRVELLPSSIERLQSWQKQIDESCPEVMVTRKDLVNWVISEHKESLSDSDFRKIKECFFDPVQYLKSLLRKAEAAKLKGKIPEISELIGNAPRNRKTKSLAATEKSDAQEPGDSI